MQKNLLTDPKPRISEEEIQRVIDLLAAAPPVINGGWMRRADVARRLGLDLRILRLTVSAAVPRILSGQRGYKLLSQCTADEIRQCAEQWKKQAKTMLRNIIALNKAAHAKIG